MSNTIRYKDLSGNVRTIDFDPTYNVKIVVESNTIEWDLITDDPVIIPLLTTHVGGRPNDRS